MSIINKDFDNLFDKPIVVDESSKFDIICEQCDTKITTCFSSDVDKCCGCCGECEE